ncbi:MAG: DUF748 domain-containing protein [Burkholderiaceae bacterium]|jgi:uncharacterized protein involved in outer membrane biogenesis|nr:DUF748 domain-containing protein [Burkholderiaceae bacterium]
MMRKPDLAKVQTWVLRHRRRLVIGAAVVCFIWLAGALSLAFFLPGFIKSKAEQAVSAQLHRKLAISDISLNPLTLGLTLKGVTLSENNSEETFASFDRLYVNLSLWSAFTMSPVIEAVELENPYIRLSRLKSNTYNISDFIEMGMKPDEPGKKPLSYSVNNIQVTGGRIVFDDRPMKIKHHVEQLDISLPFIASSDSDVETFIEPHLSALVNGHKVELSGKTRPFAEDKETTFNLALKQIALPRYMEYLPWKPAFNLEKGSLSVDLNLHFAQHDKKQATFNVSGMAEIDALRITAPDKKPLLGFGKLRVKLNKNAIFAGKYDIARIELLQPEVNAVNNPAGMLNLLSLAPAAGKGEAAGASDKGKKESAKPEPEEKRAGKPFRLALKQFILKEGKLRYTDYAAGMPYSVSTERFNLTVEDVAVDMSANSTRIGRIASDSAALEMALEKKAPNYVAPRKTAAASSGGGMAVEIGGIDISGWSAHVQNNNLKNPMGGSITGLTAHLKDISTVPGKTGTLSIAAKVDKKGHISIEGKAGASPLTADLAVELKGVSIVAVQQYIDEHVNLTLRQADVSTKGHLTLASGKHGETTGEYRGDVSVSNLFTADQIKGDPFVRWKDLSVKQMQVKFSPFSLTAKQVDLNSFYARLILGADGRLNLQNILRSKAGGKKSLTDSEAHDEVPSSTESATASAETSSDVIGDATGESTPSHVPEQAARDLPPIRIDRFRLSNGRVRFTDNFIKPHYTANMDKFHGEITRVSSAGNESANLDFKGEVNRAPLTVNGSLNPFNPALSLAMEGHVKGMELAQFSSYSSKYVGYGIEKGKLSFDVKYTVENGDLHAENRLVLDQLTFGPKTEEKPVVDLPVEFAVNLLKDGDGVIDLNLPVSGSLNDPEFSVGGVVVRMFFNLIKKAVTSPFSLLALAFGGGEELSWLEFTPGVADITDQGDEKLAMVVKALKGRPALKLDITGCYDPVKDREGLARVAIDRKIRQLKRKEMGDEGRNLRLSQITVSDKEYEGFLKDVYSDADFKKPRNFIGLQKSLPRAEMEKLLIENYTASEEEFMKLADKRAMAVKAWLVDKGGIPDDRIFILASKRKEGEHATCVDFSLH